MNALLATIIILAVFLAVFLIVEIWIALSAHNDKWPDPDNTTHWRDDI